MQERKWTMSRRRVIRLRHFFTESPGGVIVYAINVQRQAELPDQKAIIEDRIAKLRLPITEFRYETTTSNTRPLGKGEVMVDGRKRPPIIWVENQQHAYTPRYSQLSKASSSM